MLKPVLVALRSDYAAAAAAIAGLSQLSALSTLFAQTTSDILVYALSATICVCTGLYAWKYGVSCRRERFHQEKARTFKVLSILFVVLAVASLSPAIYRFIYVHTTWLTPNSGGGYKPPIVGQFFGELVSSANAASDNVQVYAVLDVSRTSVRCVSADKLHTSANEVADWASCQRFSVPDSDLMRFLYGWRQYDSSSDYEARRVFEKRYFSTTVKAAHRAMLAIPRLAANPAVRNYEFPIKVGLYHEWKQRLFSEELLPTVAEWATLRRDAPELAAALRKYLVEVVGVLDPIFIVSVHNKSSKPIEISRLGYTAKLVGVHKALLLTGYERPRYVLELEEGKHKEPLIPPITVAANSIEKFDLLITMKNPHPGHEYELMLSFGSPEEAQVASLPVANFVFWQGKDN